MQFQVPQFIEVEDKIIGPLTFRQFVYILGGLGGCYIIWQLLPIIISLPLILGVGGIAAALSFVEYNGRPFNVALENGFFYLIRGKFYLWDNKRKATKKEKQSSSESAPKALTYVPKLSESRLRDLSWSLDIKERVAAGVATEEDRGTDVVLKP